MGFQFRFQRALDHREEMEKKALLEAVKTQMRRDQEVRGLARLLREADELRRRWEGLCGRTIPMEEVRWINRRWMDVQVDLRRQRSVVDEWEHLLEEARGRWMEARRAKKALALLKEKALERHLSALRKAETEQLDEASLRPYVEEASNLG